MLAAQARDALAQRFKKTERGLGSDFNSSLGMAQGASQATKAGDEVIADVLPR